MGKGTGACASKPETVTAAAAPAPPPPAPATSSAPAPAEPAPAPAPIAAAPAAVVPTPAKMTKVWIIFYSMYGHIKTLAEEIKKGVESVEGVTAEIYQVPELLSADILEKMHAPPKSDYPIVDPHKLPEADAFVFGFPTRFGSMASQFKAFFDATGSLWQSGALHGKPAGLFTSTATQGGGQETTILTAVTQLAHHGMIYVPTGYAAGAGLFDVEVARGGSPYGAGTLAGPTGARSPSAIELELALTQGKLLAGVAKKLSA